MRRSVTCIVLIVFFYCQCAPRRYAGYRRIDVPIVISDVVGEIFDAEERSKYDLFRGVNDFEQARFYAIEEGGLCAEIQTVHYKMISVNRDPQMHMILKEYIEEYEWIKKAREQFETRWQIVDYDVLGFPITHGEVSRFTAVFRNCGCMLASAVTVTGIFWLAALVQLLQTTYVINYEEYEDRAQNLFIIGIGAGLLTGALTGLLIGASEKSKALDIIKESRMPRAVE